MNTKEKSANMTAIQVLALLKKKKDTISRGHLSELKNTLSLLRGEHYEFDNRGRIFYTPAGVALIVNRPDGRSKGNRRKKLNG